jgi:IS30 family transposase
MRLSPVVYQFGRIVSMEQIQIAIQNLESKGWTVAAIADAMGVRWQTIYRWKRGANSPASEAAVVLLLSTLEGRKEVPKRRRERGKTQTDSKGSQQR